MRYRSSERMIEMKNERWVLMNEDDDTETYGMNTGSGVLVKCVTWYHGENYISTTFIPGNIVEDDGTLSVIKC